MGLIDSGGLMNHASMVDVATMTGASLAWPAANRAMFFPFAIEITVTAYQMWWYNGATVNNTANDMDVGIYDVLGNRLVRQGGTIAQTPINALQVSDISDTVLIPGVYYMAMCVGNTTCTFIRRQPSALSLQVCGVQQQAVGAVGLPDPATFANPTSAYQPVMGISLATAF
jgi:hypothetical protein